jgi:hypothetical protein
MIIQRGVIREAALAWDTVIFKIPDQKNLNKQHNSHWICPMCEGKALTIPYGALAKKAFIKKYMADEKEFLVLICDRCGQLVAFEGCTGICASEPKSKCEVCGKYYCKHCGITVDFETDGGVTEMRYCNDHIPEWYKNR